MAVRGEARGNGFLLTEKEALASDPAALLKKISDGVSFPEMRVPSGPEDMRALQEGLVRCSSYICFFTELETAAKVRKRAARSEKRTAEAERLLGVENVLCTFRQISQQNYECITKLMTAERLMLDEAKALSSQI